MAKLTFFVARRGTEKVECSAEIPHSKDYAGFKGGKITCQTPKGEVVVEVPGFKELFLDSLTIVLQNPCRDKVYPESEAKTTSSKRSRVEE